MWGLIETPFYNRNPLPTTPKGCRSRDIRYHFGRKYKYRFGVKMETQTGLIFPSRVIGFVPVKVTVRNSFRCLFFSF